MSREAIKASLMAQAESRIDALLADASEAKVISLQEIETSASEAGQAFGEAVLQALVEEASEASVTGPLKCPHCQQPLQKKGLRSRQVVSTAGEVKLKRTYYHCPRCHQGFFPLG